MTRLIEQHSYENLTFNIYQMVTINNFEFEPHVSYIFEIVPKGNNPIFKTNFSNLTQAKEALFKQLDNLQ